MADVIQLSSAVSTQYEPKRKCRWLLYFPLIPHIAGVDAGTRSETSAEGTTDLTFAAHTCSRPGWSVNPIEVHRLHERFRFAGKVDWNEMSCSFYDFTGVKNSVGQLLWEWGSVIYNPLDGTMGYASEYKVDGSLAMLDPHGNTIQQFNLFGWFPISIDFQDLSYEDDAAAEIAATGRFDFAIKNPDVVDETYAT